MNKVKLLLALLFFLLIYTNSFGQTPGKWGDQNDGTYCNPVLPSDYSDIDAIRVDSDYYAISSTFQYSPGVVILHSKDLVNWEILSHVVTNVIVMGPDYNWDKMNRYGHGVWAGSIRYYKGKFWVYFGTPDDGYFMSSATNPAGPWEPLTSFWKVTGWDDCCSFCDDDGQLYFIATNYADNYKIHLFKMAVDGKSLDLNSDVVIHQSTGSEANKLYKIKDWYYHFFSEVKTEGRVMMMERSKTIFGPYTEIKQLNHVNVSGLNDREPNQGGLIQLLDSTWQFFTHHGSGAWEGRTASLLPVTWIDGWPIVGNVGTDGIGIMMWSGKMPLKSNKSCYIHTNDEFEKSTVEVQWEWNYQPRADKWALAECPGFLRLKAFQPVSGSSGLLFRAGNTITQRSMKTKLCEAVTKIHIGKMADGQVAGICHYANTYAIFGVKQISGIRYITYDNNGTETVGKAISDTIIYLKSTWGLDGNNQYSYSVDDSTFITFGNTYALTWGNYRGDRIGIFTYNQSAENGYIDVDWFHYDYNAKPPVVQPVQPVNPGTANLTHQWMFNDGTANDLVGSANGILRGGATIVNNALKTDSAGQYLELPASQLGISTYPALSMEAWFTSKAGINTGNTMLCYFGNTLNGMGSNGCFISVARADNVSRVAISCGNTTAPWNAENYVNSDEMDDGLLHQVVSVITLNYISYYVDGVKAGSSSMNSGNSLANLILNYAYLGKSGYNSDPTWLGSIDKFSLYNKALSDGEVLYLYQNRNGTNTDSKESKQNRISIYPNPAHNFIYFQSDKVISNGEFRIINIAGQVIYSQRLSYATNGKFNISTYTSGLYVVNINSNELNQTVLIEKMNI
jgi:beta-xylosidase